MVKNFLFLSIFLQTLSASAQHFEWEFRLFILQDYFQQNGIKQLIIGRDKDSATAASTTTVLARFDEKGRLAGLSHKFSDNRWQHINYSYTGSSRMYTWKQNYLIDSAGIKSSEDHWIIHAPGKDEYNEFQLSDNNDTARINHIVFDPGGNILSRTTANTHSLLYLNKFKYSSQQLTEVGIFTGSHRKDQRDTLHHRWTLHIDYNNNQPVAIKYVTGDSSRRSAQSIHLQYIGEKSILMSDSLFYKTEHYLNGQKHTKYAATVHLANITIDNNGLVCCLHRTDETVFRFFDRYTIFRYEFFPGAKCLYRHPGDFLTSYVVDLSGPTNNY